MVRSLEDAVRIQYVRSGGAGGQHVNKVATAAQVHLGIDKLGLSPGVAERLRRIAGQRLTERGEIVVFADRFRSQVRNREDAMQRLADMLERAKRTPKRRIATKPTRAAKTRRLDTKKKQGERKQMRRKPKPD
ncbi:MAG: alternative ribosome rescue aminoacyl-tRNA hydrolase ArfB [Pseudomonadales bacterium]|nr:alternative ribosome rescue aminoacyl-tRNA hydrolase ArfB [Pseudomonadales bacterium]MDP6471479.1 alternative ribosome rescue aminoacyl-tRNA hydrolase ArfB [Pseudomonadales bacterium]MDP6828648.1 alternative ribosome rescue aminoacyl-tRNA hydrolase ArfB [Pseudomonadales bacterium]MDP6972367.1 alternative ribosome rescue aminoacyl-tRNA hydrolase ArfB [Pseudomonadales bacterium]|tara:strand:- start:4241 stop:4639 length:399 start_codon:yes stop_codon:yes gene_type:complete